MMRLNDTAVVFRAVSDRRGMGEWKTQSTLGNSASPWLVLYFKTQENNFYLMKENEKLCLQKMQIGNVV